MKTKKFLSLMFAFAFLLSLLPANIAYAADYAGGSGTASSPYLISNLTQLKNFRNNVNGGNAYSGTYFKLTADINLGGSSSNQWTPIANDSSYYFKGTFDGDGHKITGLYINNTGSGKTGLFGNIDTDGTVKNLGVSGTVIGSDEVGGVADINYGVIENCYFTGSITANDKWGGGIVGRNFGTVKNCYNTADINGGFALGGIVGLNYGTVENCYNTGSVTGKNTDTGNGARSGGIVGVNSNYASSKGSVKNCYSIGTVKGKYNVGGVVAVNSCTITNCYYLNTCAASGTTFTNTDAASLTAAQMKDKSNYSGWDFSNTWYMAGSRPLLSSNLEITLTPTTNKYDLDGDGTKDTVYEISTAEQFLDFGAAVNNNNRKLNAVLTKDIDLSGYTWSPIGVYNSDFEGIFDGQNHTVSNMKFTTVQHGYNHLTYDYQGLFGVIRNSAVVRNFTLKGDITLAADAQEFIGGVVGLAYEGSKILNVTSYVNITDGGTAYSDIKWIGGVAGQIGTDGKTSGYIDWCKYYGTINVDTAAKVGGIVGCAVNDSYVTNSTNYGKVGWNYIGHIAGVVGSATTGTHVVNCANYGEVSANCHDCIGGVVGYANQYVTINNCLNGGNISGQPASGSDNEGAYIGGILGYINNSNFAGLTNCFNYGTVKNSGGTDTYVGALGGWLRNGAANVKDNYYLKDSCAKAHGGNSGTNNTAVTAIQAASGEIAYKLQGSQSEQVWGQTLTGENYDTYPVLGGAKVYYGTKCNGVATYANTAVPTSHSYSNGVCQNCGASQTISTNSDGYYEISSKADYINFTNSVNGGETEAKAVLTADIDLSGYDYIPIGIDGNAYKGTFDGAGHKIENLTITANDSYMGMFGKTNGAAVKNFTVSGNITAVCNTLENIGGVIGLADSTSVSDVISKVNLKDNGKIEHIYRAGGIAAQARYGSSFKNCEYSGDIALHFGSHTTGIVGVASDAGKDNPIVIENCVNKANMKFDISRRVAGIVGWVDTYTTVSKCANYGNITIKESDGINQAAGIVAVNVGPLTVEDCANYGNITDGKINSSLGGIVGFLDVYQNTSDFGGVKNCFNYGTITNTNADGSTYWGSVIGYIKNDDANSSIVSKITNNYYLDGTAPTISGTEGIALTATEVSADMAASGELAHTLQGTRTDNVWGQTLTGTGTTVYPVPNGDRVYKITFIASNATYAAKYANAAGVGTLPENPGDGFVKWLCGNTADSAEFTATTPVNSDMTVYAFKMDTPQASDESDEITIMSGQNVEIDLRNYVKSQFGSNFKFSVADGSTLPSGLTLADDGYTIVGATSVMGQSTVTFDVENYNIALFSMNDEGTLLTVKFVVIPAIDGNGTAESPYLIKTTDDLIKLRDQVNGGGTFEGKVIKLATDLNLNGSKTNQWTPIGTVDNQFKGTFDGDGHKISGLYIESTSDYQGLFGCIDGKVENLSIDGIIKGYSSVGGVAGYSCGTIANCSFVGSVGGDSVGGVVGWNGGTVNNCYNTGSVGGDSGVGGVVGWNGGTVTNCYNTGSVSGTGDYIGGIAGYNNSACTIEYSYNTGSVSGKDEVGGVVGKNHDDYMDEEGKVEYCYYLNTCAADGTTFTNKLGTALTAEEMKDSANYTDWDFTSTWEMGVFSPMLKSNPEKGTKNTATVIISRSYDLEEFRNSVNKGETFEGEYILLTADIDLKDIGEQWTPIGTENSQFKGTFDGDGHKISGLYITETPAYHQGLFGCVGVGGIVKNLNADGSVVGGPETGGIVGENCGMIENCNFTGNVGQYSCVGGIAGVNNGTIKNCHNDSNVNGANGSIGGIAGDNCGMIENCYNTGSVTGYKCVGGITGYNNSEAIVNNCYNTGILYGNEYIGGVVGYNISTGTVTNCCNTGSVSGSGTNVGGALGYNSTGTATNCYYLNTCAADGTKFDSTVGTALTAAQMKDSASFKDWDFENTWTMGYFSPMLKSNPEKGTKNAATVIITSLNELETFRDDVNNGTSYEGEYILLTADIDLGGGDSNQWTPIGTENSQFKGTFDGDGHKISGLYIMKLSYDHQSLFGYVGVGGIVKNLNADGSVAGERYVSGIVGENCGMIENCSFTGKVSSYATTGAYVGGIAGVNNGTIKNCHNDSNVNGANGYSIGGIAGNNCGMIENCYNMGSVTGYEYVGGVTGWNDGTVINSYNTGSAAGVQYIGGVTGINNGTATNCYNTGSVKGTRDVGGVTGKNDGTVKNCYYLDTCAADGTTFTTKLGTVLTAAQMKDSANYTDWDFTGIWTMGTVSPYLKSIPEKGTKNTADKVIYTLDDMIAFCNDVNGGKTFEGKYIVLTADIDLGGSKDNQWTPIGTAENQFKGTFDGDGHKISGLYIANTSDYQGLFGYVGENGTVKDLTVDGSVKGAMYIGGIAGGNGGLIENCSFSGNVGGEKYVGGVVGENKNNGTITNCCNRGSVSGTDKVGGIAGNNERTIKNCSNIGKVESKGTAGGVAGINNRIIEMCYNVGTITGEYDVGGIAGGNYNDAAITNCYNTGSISGSNGVGGVTGCNLCAAITNCYNTGSIGGNRNIGGLVGGNQGGTATNCYYLSTCGAEGEGTALTAVQMKNSSSFAGWNFGDTWVIKNNRPLLRSNIESKFSITSVGAADAKATAKVYVPKAGTYTVVFADYENGKLNNSAIVTVTVAESELGDIIVTSNADITLGTGDKVMLWTGVGAMTPLCGAYEVK